MISQFSAFDWIKGDYHSSWGLPSPLSYIAQLSTVDDLPSNSTSGSSTADLSPVPSSSVQDDEPEAEDRVQVETKPTDEDDFVAKVFDAPSQHIQDLTNKNVMKHNKDRILLTAVANGGMAEYTLNWIASLKRTKLDDKYLVFAMEDQLEGKSGASSRGNSSSKSVY
ncbi:hypothetical protein [Absidia glauca]|uniref:Uncharacterized protein n=1 Tax=Absidia glauca TaxID=4829 RepID=A0A163K3Y3_ABSGL|nr:hypothetical protein [Absidia glauca]